MSKVSKAHHEICMALRWLIRNTEGDATVTVSGRVETYHRLSRQRTITVASSDEGTLQAMIRRLMGNRVVERPGLAIVVDTIHDRVGRLPHVTQIQIM